MDCIQFQSLINDFIYDKIQYSEDLEEFLNHAKECKTCNEELALYYTIQRGLGDVKSPEGKEEVTDIKQELDNIFDFYNEYFYKQKFMKKAGKISIVVFAVMIICTVIFIYLYMAGLI